MQPHKPGKPSKTKPSASSSSARPPSTTTTTTKPRTKDGEDEEAREAPFLDISRSITKSGATNLLSSQFLRDTDEDVAQRKLLASLPLCCPLRPILPRTYHHLPFPTRQDWSSCQSAQELHQMEEGYFAGYLQSIYAVDSKARKFLSPFEHNLEVWRQLWRVLEKSHVVLLVADVRDPLLHIPSAFHDYITRQLQLPLVIVLSKCDLVSDAHAQQWKRYLEQHPKFGYKTRVVVNSGKCISTHGVGNYSARKKLLHARATKAQVQQMHDQAQFCLDVALECAARERLLQAGSEQEQAGVVQIGVVGQPNAGKSSLVNAILGRHAVSVSRTSGHTKHWQTQNIYAAAPAPASSLTEVAGATDVVNDNKTDRVLLATIIDSPGLIFPMMVDDSAEEDLPRAWFECSGLYRVSQIRECYSAVRFVGERLDLPKLYALKLDKDDYGESWTPYAFLGSLADKRGFTIRGVGGAPDIHRAGLDFINDVCDGVVLLCFPPPPPPVDADGDGDGDKNDKI